MNTVRIARVAWAATMKPSKVDNVPSNMSIESSPLSHKVFNVTSKHNATYTLAHGISQITVSRFYSCISCDAWNNQMKSCTVPISISSTLGMNPAPL